MNKSRSAWNPTFGTHFMGSCCVGWEASLVKNHNGKT